MLAKAYHNLGVIRELVDGDGDQKLVRKRLKLFRKALELKPNRINTMFSLFLTHVALSEFDAAEKVFRDALKHEGFLNHVRTFLRQESADVLRQLAIHLDPTIMDLAFPKKNSEV